MSRHRALLAASQMGGGKIVNHGVLVVKNGVKLFTATLTFDFPCASLITVIFSTTHGAKYKGISQGDTSTKWDDMGQVQSFSYSPTEDDTYIYEIELQFI